LEHFAPPWVEITTRRDAADIVVEHVIGADAIGAQPEKPYVVIQYCFASANSQEGFDVSSWNDYWTQAELVWSYYDLTPYMPHAAKFYHAPLGVDSVFRTQKFDNTARPIGVVTSGYVNGPGAEAIEDVAHAAKIVGQRVVHIGPMPTNLSGPMPDNWCNLFDIPDSQLAHVYCNARWVSGLRYGEGFELPALEGLACGARPILFARPDMQWYAGHGTFIPETVGPPLVDALVRILSEPPRPVPAHEHEALMRRFDWKYIVGNFWRRLERVAYSSCDVGSDIIGGGAS
jgi:hypothetical protein